MLFLLIAIIVITLVSLGFSISVLANKGPSGPSPTPACPNPPCPPTPPSPPPGDWIDGLALTHYYDCGGQSCDASFLQWPEEASKFVAGPGYTILDPNDFGGSLYGEKMWIYGAASDTLAEQMGDNITGLGKVTQGPFSGACGKSILIKNSDAKNADWTALVMRKSRCPPWSKGCEDGAIHMDLMIPGFDDLGHSTANSCGNPGTGMSKTLSAICGPVPNPSTCTECDKLPSIYQKACKLFVEWGWNTGNPTAQYQIVDTPKAFLDYTKKIQLGGKCSTGYIDNKGQCKDPPPLPPPPAPKTCTSYGLPLPQPGAPEDGCCINSVDAGKGDFCKKKDDYCGQSKENCAGCSGNIWCTN